MAQRLSLGQLLTTTRFRFNFIPKNSRGSISCEKGRHLRASASLPLYRLKKTALCYSAMSTGGVNGTPRVIEVERKFLCPTDMSSRLEQLGATQIKSQTFTDCYYDNSNFSLTLADHWLRSRAGIWQLKSPPNHRVTSSNSAQYLESESLTDIIQALTQVFASSSSSYGSIEELLEAQNLKVFAKYQTTRRRYELGEFLVVLDEADFGYQVGEVEMVVSTQEEQVKTAIQEVDDMVKKLGVDSARRIPGKMEAYLKKNNPDHLQLLLDKHILGQERS